MYWNVIYQICKAVQFTTLPLFFTPKCRSGNFAWSHAPALALLVYYAKPMFGLLMSIITINNVIIAVHNQYICIVCGYNI